MSFSKDRFPIFRDMRWVTMSLIRHDQIVYNRQPPLQSFEIG
jgi:hypothetical protein